MSKFKFKKRIYGGLLCEVVNPVTKNFTVFYTSMTDDGLFLEVYDSVTMANLVDMKQIEGTAQFTIRGIKFNSQKAKMRKYIKNYFKEFWDCEI